MPSSIAPLLFALMLCSAHAQQLLDPIANFCRRFAHQTTVIDERLYIDGGYVDYGGSIDSNTVNYTNTYLIYADTDTNGPNNFPTQHSNITKPPNVPSVVGGTLWADQVNKLFYMFGGEYNATTYVPRGFDGALWYFDTLFNTWKTTPSDPTYAEIIPPSFGASAVDQNQGIAYYYGGWRSNASEYNYAGAQDVSDNRLKGRDAQSKLISYNMVTNQWQAVSFIDETPRAEGALFYLPASDGGLLIYFGGVEKQANGTYTGVSMSTIYVYDIASGKSYSQSTSGTPPGPRRRFCGGASWPEDRSSYQIYLFGGLPPYDQEGYGYGDAWILSIPSFTWTVYYYTEVGAHHSLSCDVINEGQMLITGGYFPNSTNTDCDAKPVWGMHNLNLGSNDVAGAEWYIYLPNLTYYSVPPNITEVIGGGANGSATLRTPRSGNFDNEDLAVYMNRVATTSTRTATRDVSRTDGASQTSSPAKSGSGTNVGAIVGGVVGGIAALTAITILACLCIRRRRKRRIASPQILPPAPVSYAQENRQVEMAEVPGQDNFAAAHKRGVSATTTSPAGGGWIHTPMESPPTQHTNWAPVPMAYSFGPQQPQHFREDLPPQLSHYPAPPQPQQYYPPPPQPQQYDPPSPTYEMPSVRSPTNVADLNYPGSTSPRARRTPSAGVGNTINEE